MRSFFSALLICASVSAVSAVDEKEAYEIGLEAYVYFYPLVSMDVTRRVLTNQPADSKPGVGPKNQFHHMRQFPPAGFKEVVRPNFDTLYSSAWVDLRNGPVVVSVPDTGGRYYLLPMLDLWTDVFASPGKRTSGTSAGNYVLTPPEWKGVLPRGMERIESPGHDIWIIGRTQTNGPKDYEAVHKIQDGFKITPLSQWGKPGKPVKHVMDPSVDLKRPPLVQVDTMPAAEFFSCAVRLMRDNPPHVTDWSQLARFRRIGIEPGKDFVFEKSPGAVRSALERAASDGLKNMKAKIPTLARVVNGWQMNTDTMGVYGNFYLKRAIVAMVGLGANQPEDAIYPLCLTDADGKPLEGGRKYVLHFSKDELPPVGAFWSVTMYDEAGFQIPNKLNRFAIGDRDSLHFNSDGSLDLYLQPESPGADKVSNWLPSSESGRLGVTMRLYAPQPQAIDGRWAPPPIRRN